MKILAWGAVVMSSVALLAACGGGGSGGTGGGTAGGGTTGSTTSGTGTTSMGTTSMGTTSMGTTSSSGVTTNPGDCGSLIWDDNADCQTCVETSCCAELKACDTGSDCGALLDCINGCGGDQTCANDCIANNMAGLSDAQAMANCFTNSCESDEACASGAICDSGLEHPDPACGQCLGTNCCTEFTDCVADAATDGCLDCVTGAASDDTKCAMNALFTAVTTCRDGKCGQFCASGICDSGLTTNNAPCDNCLSMKCCAPIKACADDQANPSCLDACILAATPDPDCNDGTTALGALFKAAQMCWNTQCSGANDCNSML